MEPRSGAGNKTGLDALSSQRAGTVSETPGPRQASGMMRNGNKGWWIMDDAGIGWIAAIIIGGLAGWIASNFMKSDTGIFMNILLGIIGAVIASFLFGLLGVSFGGWLGYLVAGVIGACILIWGARAVRS